MGKIQGNRYNHQTLHAYLTTEKEINLYFYSVIKRLQIKNYKVA